MPTLTMPTRDYGLMLHMKANPKLNDDIDLEFTKSDNILANARQMVRELAYDICEMPFTTYICAKDYGQKFTALPTFITRNFHHGAIHVDTTAGIETPKDLEGKTMGVVRGYTVTTGVWARTVLSIDHGVDLTKVQWTCTDDEHVAGFKLPTFADYDSMGRDFAELFAEKKIVGAVGTLPKDVPNVAPLIPNPVEAGFDSYRKTGVYPVNHAIVVKDELLERYPTLAVDLFKALVDSKRAYLDNLDRSGDLSAEDALTVRLEKGVDGDPFPYGVEPNRKGLEALTQSAFDQLITARKYSVEELFPESVLDLTG